MHPAVEDAARAAHDVRTTISNAATESIERLKEISEHGLQEAQRAAQQLEDGLKPLLAEFREQNARAYATFEKNSGEFLSFQRKHVDDAANGFRAMQAEIAQFASSTTSKTDNLAKVIEQESAKSRESRTAILAAIGKAETGLSQVVISESSGIKRALSDTKAMTMETIHSLDSTVHKRLSEIEAQNSEAARKANIRFWVLIVVMVGLTLLQEVIRH
jgi:hypothetical protein